MFAFLGEPQVDLILGVEAKDERRLTLLKEGPIVSAQARDRPQGSYRYVRSSTGVVAIAPRSAASSISSARFFAVFGFQIR